jgi:hypothetical protein
VSAGNTPISARAPEDIHTRIEAAAARVGISKSEWILEAVRMVLEDEERSLTPRAPAAVEEATPRIRNGRIALPRGRIFDRFPDARPGRFS